MTAGGSREPSGFMSLLIFSCLSQLLVQPLVCNVAQQCSAVVAHYTYSVAVVVLESTKSK